MRTHKDIRICRRIPGILVACFVMLLIAPITADDLTLVCDYCGKPITGKYVVTDSGTYHKSCYEDHVAPRCAVCGQIIEGEYFIDPWGNFVHTHHKGDVPQCEYCNRFISEYTTGGGYRYADGRFVCKLCEASSVDGVDEAREIMESTSAFLKKYGIEIEIDDVPVYLVDRNEMARLQKDEEGDPHGFTYLEQTTTIGGLILERNFRIYMLTGTPRMYFIATMAHELMHVWLHENAPEDIDPALCEGSCNYASYLTTGEYSGTDADYIKTTLHENPDPIYGDGFRGVAEFVDEHGIESWLSYLRENSTPPW